MLYYKKTMLTALSLLIVGSNSTSNSANSAGDREVLENHSKKPKSQTRRQINRPANKPLERDQSPVRLSISEPQNEGSISKRMASEISGTREKTSKKIKISPTHTPDEGVPIFAEESTILPQYLGWLLQTPQVGTTWAQVKKRILRHLPPKTQQDLALVCSASFETVLEYRMNTDPRKLQEKPWVQGPPVGSPELYRFNAAVFHALTYAIKVRSELQTKPAPLKQLIDTIPISRAYTFLLEAFHHTYPNATDRVKEFIENIIEYFRTGLSVHIIETDA